MRLCVCMLVNAKRVRPLILQNQNADSNFVSRWVNALLCEKLRGVFVVENVVEKVCLCLVLKVWKVYTL